MEQTPAGISVDLGGLRMFADMLRSDVELGLRPGVDRAEHDVQRGVRFGLAAPGGHVAASREVFAAALQRAEENVKRQVQAAQILTTAIETILANYADADRLAARQMAIVERTLSDAITAAEAAARRGPQPVGGFYE